MVNLNILLAGSLSFGLVVLIAIIVGYFVTGGKNKWFGGGTSIADMPEPDADEYESSTGTHGDSAPISPTSSEALTKTGDIGVAFKRYYEAQEKLDRERSSKELTSGLLGAAGTLAGIEATKMALKPIARRLGTKLAKTSFGIAIRRLSSTLIRKLGITSATKLIGKLALKVGSRLGRAATLAAKLKPSPLMVLEIASMVLDLVDPVGYGNIQYNENMLKIRNDAYALFEDEMKKENVTLPLVMGPLSYMDEETLEKEYNAQLETFFETEMTPVMDALKTRIEQAGNSLTETMIETWIQEEFTKLLNDQQNQKFMDAICVKHGGKVVGTDCSYKDRASCDKSYNWPLEENDTYVEWKDDKCVLALPNVPLLCHENGIPYDSDTGLCKITKEYCLGKGADYVYNERTNAMDCSINVAQGIGEFILGTTVLRGLKQTFDLSQYESCKPNEIDDGFFCRDANCQEGEDKDGGLCYKKCDAGYTGVGPICWQRCDSFGQGYTDWGAFCTRDACGPNEDTEPGFCFEKCKPGYHGKSFMCWQDCPEGWTDAGLCWKPTYGRGGGYAAWDKGLCEKDHGVDNCEQWGLMWYPKCKPGYSPFGCCICKWTGGCPEGMKDNGDTCEKSSYTRKMTSSLDTKTKHTYGRGAGYVPAKIRAKQRILDYGGPKPEERRQLAERKMPIPSHGFWKNVNRQDGVLEVQGDSYDNHAKVGMIGKEANTHRLWKYVEEQSQLRALSSGKCLDVPGNDAVVGKELGVYQCEAGNDAQKFKYDQESRELKHVPSGLCVDMPGGNTSDGTRATLYTCNNSFAQKFNFVPPPSPMPLKEFYLRAREIKDNFCLRATGAHNGAALEMHPCTGSNSERFIYDPVPKRIQSVSSGKCLDLDNGDTKDGAKLQLWDCHDGYHQKWTYNPENKRIVNMATEKCVDIPNASDQNGVRVQQWSCNDTKAQKFDTRNW